MNANILSGRVGDIMGVKCGNLLASSKVAVLVVAKVFVKSLKRGADNG